MKINVLVVDSDVNHVKAVKKVLSNAESVSLTCAYSKSEALESIRDANVIIVDMLLNGMDSISLIQQVRNQDENKIIIATSQFISSDMMDTIANYQISYFIKKPFDVTILEEIIKVLYIKYSSNKISDKPNIRLEITNLLHSLGIPSNIKGYNYVRDGIEMIYKDSSLVGSITKELYPAIATVYDTTSSRVERAIRHAIEVSWMRGDYTLMEEIFGNSVDYDRSKPTNSEFIVTLADRLKLKNKLYN